MDEQLLKLGIKARRAELEAELAALDQKEATLQGRPATGNPVTSSPRKRQISEETRKKMAAAAKRRWAAKTGK